MIIKPKIQDTDSMDTDSNSESDNSQPVYEIKKKAHHNTLERKRRNTLMQSFYRLKRIVPNLANEEITSRAQILESAADFIDYMEEENHRFNKIIRDITARNLKFKQKISILEKVKKADKIEKADIDAILSVST